jgi:hypothetical protein
MNQDILIQLLNDKVIYNQIIKDFPGLYSACLTIKQNVSSEGVDKSIEKILNFYKNNENFKLLIDTLKQQNNNNKLEEQYNIIDGNDVIGMVIILDKKEESFKKLMQTAKKEKWQYRGIAILDQFDSIRLYFY